MREPSSQSRATTLDSAANALRIIGLLRTRQQITVTEVSHELGVGKSTAHRLLSTLVAEGFVERDPVHRRYHPGHALVAAGLAAIGDLDVRRRSWQPMRSLSERTGETVKLLVLQGCFARCIALAESTNNLRVTGQVGQLLPANAGAGGKLLLAHSLSDDDDEDDLRRRYPKSLPALTDQTITDWDEMVVELQRIRERGWATDFEEGEDGVNGLAVAVPGLKNRVVAALTISGPVARLPLIRHQEILRHMHATVAQISRGAEISSRRRAM